MATVRYFAGAAEAAGRDEERLGASDLGALRAAMLAAHGDALARVLGRCSILVNGRRVDDDAAPIRHDDTVDILPPFAGG
ncbi:MoaD/ThiS family protein [Agromyces sp. CFH 90414]|uniref:Molybdopterin synthase sulfur carrier subunit n=1 Tax=Agromyces agglutinans TaxID=2662258 RepID=A0A6I2FEN2_9MICO|nr:MoaD/ThiS family protein [Agromyces agglutinans]MRG61150.1 MoaD/ThiS family protein [Agromyces agglutinans]